MNIYCTNNNHKSWSKCMKVRNPHSIRPLSVAIPLILMSLSLSTGVSAQTADDIEEVVVTGTFIRQTAGFTTASPITQLTAEDITNQGTVNMAEVVSNSVFNLGTGTNNGIQGTSDLNSTFNLRGLGPTATLLLMDGVRTPNDNVQTMMPNIAIQRIDILKDGAAQLYGSDAVAGVVNYIPYTSYDGFKMEYFQEQDDPDTYKETSFQFITGFDLGDNANIVVAGSRRETGDLRWTERPEHIRAGLSSSGNANPSNFIVPLRDENGLFTGKTQSRPDPNCAAERGDPAQPGANPNGFLYQGNCWIDFGDGRSHRNAINYNTLYTALSWNASDDVAVKATINYSRLQGKFRGSVAGSGVNRSLFPDTVRGEQPGNQFRATNSLGEPLFAQDANGDTLPDRDANNVVILDPKGIPFNEDVGFGRMRIVGKSQSLLGTGIHNTDKSMHEDRDRRALRFTLNSTFTVPYVNDWEGSATYAFMNNVNVEDEPRAYSASGITAGLSCDVLNAPETCYSPFAPIPGSSSATNSDYIMSTISSRDRQHNTSQMQTFDLVFNGAIPLGGFELPGGEIGAAIGYQHRRSAFDDRPAASRLTGDAVTLSVAVPFGASNNVNSVFAEFQIPILDNFGINYAIRDERFSTGQAETVQKIGVVYEPLDWLTFRGTFGEAFLAPSLRQLNAPETCGSTGSIQDPFTSFSGYLFGCLSGNPDLVSETSETMSVGMDLNFDNGLRASLTWSETDFTNRLIVSNNQDVVNVDFFNFKAATGFAATAGQPLPTAAAVLAWQASPLSDPRIVRSATDPGIFERISRGTSNASTLLVESFDGEIDYSMDIADYGRFGINLAAAYMEDFLFQALPTDPIRQGVGHQNDFTGTAPAVPRVKSNLTLSWARGDHSIRLVGRYLSGLRFDANQNSRVGQFGFNNWRFTEEIRAWTQMDASYSFQGYQVPMLGEGEMDVTLGLRNAFDREAQHTGMSSGVISELQDVMGRTFYARATYSF